MEFVSLPFPYFFLLTVTFAWALRKHRLARNTVLVVASLWFAWKWQPLFLLCLVGSSLWNFAAGELVARATEERRKGWIASVAVVGNLGLLAYFKLIRDRRRARGDEAEARHRLGIRAAGWAATLLFCAFARIFFKAETLATATTFATGLFTAGGAGVGLEWSVVALSVLTLVLNFVEPPILDAFSRLHARVPTVVRPMAWAALGLVLLGVKPYDVAFTIYFGF